MVLKEMIAKNREIGKKSSSVKKEEFKKIWKCSFKGDGKVGFGGN